jgi:hypothetical protein
MGFTKRFITKEMIISKRNSGSKITDLLNCDGLISLDDLSNSIVMALSNGASEKELKKMVDEYLHLDNSN